jgi:restriction endonuclease S subunit
MSSYTITNPTLNPKRVFILQKSEVEKRFDPEYYGHIYNDYDKKLRLKPFKKFNQIIKSINNGFDFRDYKESGTPYLKVANIRKGEFRFDKIQYIDFNSSEISKNIQLKKGNILLTRKGTFGYAIALEQDYDFVISSEVFYIEIQQDLINPKFLEIFFNSEIGQAQFDKNKIGAIMGSLSQDAIRELKIPIPTIEVQKEIVSIYQKYISQKQTNEAGAEKLLASIDDYLLKELGITLPTPPENTLKNRMFIANSKDILGSRFDPHFNKTFYNEVFKSFSNSKFKVLKIKDVLENIKTGTTPNQKLEPYADENGIVFLRNTNLKKYNIDLSDTKFIKTELAKELTYSVKEEVIMCIAGTVGLSAVNNIDKPFSINQNVSALKFFDNQINSDFASYWFNTQIFLELTKRACSVATIFYLNNDNLKLLPIPVPPLAKQKEIAEHITNIRNQAQALKDKTKDLLKKASEEIEEILLN